MKARDEREQRRQVGSGGRRLDPSRDAAILKAALDGLADLGYDRLTMDEVAARAHAGKGALYRRWPSKAALIVDAVVAWRAERAPREIPDTGSLTGDIEAMIAAIPDFDEATKQQMAVLMGLLTAASRDPELRRALKENVLSLPRGIIGEVLQRAVTRGEISAQRDLDLIPDMVIGLTLMRILQGEAPDREHARRVLRTIVYPLVIARPNP